MVKCSRKFVSLPDVWVSSHEKLSDFFAGSWQKGDSAVPLLVVRLAVTALAVAILVWSLHEGASRFYPLYLTNWGIILVTAMMINGLFISIMAVCKKFPEDSGGSLPWYVSMYWFLYNVAIPLALMITTLYWALLYDSEAMEEDPSGRRMFWLDVATHGVNSCMALVELLTSRTPVRFVHVYQPLGVGLWYAAFTGIYFLAGGTDGVGNPYIYEILDWRQGSRSFAVVAASAAGVVAIHTLMWGVALCRDKVSAAVFRTTSVHLGTTPPDQHMPDNLV